MRFASPKTEKLHVVPCEFNLKVVGDLFRTTRRAVEDDSNGSDPLAVKSRKSDRSKSRESSDSYKILGQAFESQMIPPNNANMSRYSAEGVA